MSLQYQNTSTSLALDDESADALSPWWKRILIMVIVIASGLLVYITVHAYFLAPPIPKTIVNSHGTILATQEEIEDGQNVFQKFGLMNNGSVWGHGAYLGPDFSASVLHRKVKAYQEDISQKNYHQNYEHLASFYKTAIDAQVAHLLKENRFDPRKNQLVLDDVMANAWKAEPSYWEHYFHNQSLNEGLEPSVVPSPKEIKELSDWFGWAAWASSATRPGTDYSYTNNFPYEPAAGNTPIHGALIWSMLCLLTLLGGIGFSIFMRDRNPTAGWVDSLKQQTQIVSFNVTSPAQKALLKFMVVVGALFFIQTLLGGATAHYRADPTSFYGIELQKFLPSNLLRSWHLQSAIFWIATAYVASTLYLSLAFRPKDDPLSHSKGFVALINLLFTAFVVVVGGSFLGIWMGYLQKFGTWWQDLGATGWEFMEQGRIWHALLLVGLFAWIAMMFTIIEPVWKQNHKIRPLLTAFGLATMAIPVFYLPVLMIGSHTNYSVVEIWRFWVIHLWVEGYFEFFATTLVAVLFYLLGIARLSTALKTIYFDGILFFGGGILGTCHHWYFSGQDQAVMAIGALMSTMEVVPLTLLCAESWDFLQKTRMDRDPQGHVRHRWVFDFIFAAGFWNFVGAGMCGFLINLPIVSYFEVGTMLTPNHGHAAMMGVFGMLALAMLVLVTQQNLTSSQWESVEKYAKVGFWGTNIGLAGMCLLSLFPGGLLQLYDVIVNGYWHARSPLYTQQPLSLFIEWIRMFPDLIFIIFGAVPIMILVIKSWWMLHHVPQRP